MSRDDVFRCDICGVLVLFNKACRGSLYKTLCTDCFELELVESDDWSEE